MTIANHSGQFHSHDDGEGEKAALQNYSTKSHYSAAPYLMLAKKVLHDEAEKYDSLLDLMLEFGVHQSIGPAELMKRLKELLEGHRDLLLRFNAFLPEGYKIKPDDDECGARPPMKVVRYDEVLDFVHNIKERFQNDEQKYLSFNDAFRMFSQGRKDMSEVHMEVSSLFGNHPDLLEEFYRLLRPYGFTTPSIQHATYGQNLAQCFNEQCSTTAFNKQLLRQENRGLKSVSNKRKSVEKDEALRFTADFPSDDDEHTMESFESEGQLFKSSKLEDKDVNVSKEREENYEKYKGKSIRELDLSDCECCNASYRRVPNDYPIPISSGRSKHNAKVLNDHWVLVTSGSEDHSFKHMTRNQYEESLFECEDDQHELDLLIERAKSTYKRIKKIKTGDEIQKHLTVLDIKCIESLYDEHGLEVIEELFENPTDVMPVLLKRLKQKKEEWMEYRSEVNKVCAELYAKNFYKSLDYRSLYLKERDQRT